MSLDSNVYNSDVDTHWDILYLKPLYLIEKLFYYPASNFILITFFLFHFFFVLLYLED